MVAINWIRVNTIECSISYILDAQTCDLLLLPVHLHGNSTWIFTPVVDSGNFKWFQPVYSRQFLGLRTEIRSQIFSCLSTETMDMGKISYWHPVHNSFPVVSSIAWLPMEKVVPSSSRLWDRARSNITKLRLSRTYWRKLPMLRIGSSYVAIEPI